MPLEAPAPSPVEVLRSGRFGRFELNEIRYGPSLLMPTHVHPEAYVSCVLQGQYVETSDRRSELCSPSTVILHAAGEEHGDRFSQSGARCLNIYFEEDWLTSLGGTFRHTGPARASGGLAGSLARRLYRELYHPDSVSPLAVEGLLLELLAEVVRAEHSTINSPAWLEDFHQMLRQRFAEKWTLTSLARAAGVHPSHLARAFRRRYSHTIGDALRQWRVEFAASLLAETDDAISDIALAAGFSDQSHFSRVFRRLSGSTPARYREALRG